jgi:hypothetical protein
MAHRIQAVPQFENRKSKIKTNQGFALVVILAFVVLLTVLVLAYFSYSSMQRQISNSSSNQATVDIFAQGAINTIVTDFKQEIAFGSSTNVYGTNKVYIPLASSNAAPVRVGTSTNLPNLVKRSSSGLAFYPSGPARASAISSTNASQNGRSISPARWNQALLLPKTDTNSTTDFTPANFTAPDWIYVNRGGGNPTTWSAALRWNANPSDTNVVVGRFAYTIYDEGGLLDVNVAGYPPGTTNAIAGYKSPLAYADLTQVGLSTNVVSALVGWRNAATAQPGGSFPNYTFSSASQTNFFNAVSTNSRGFMRTANNSIVGGETDRMFISRQHLLQFFETLASAGVQSKASLQNTLQYFGTFSRALEQPSAVPNPNRPRIIGNAAPPAAGAADSYQGNNDGYGGDDIINPSFLSIRVKDPFARWDGTESVRDEPLVKKRFALQRLAYLTSDGPSASAPASVQASLRDAGIPQSVIDAGTDANILKCFGLTWNSGDRTWIYNHGDNKILPLRDVALANREPDFAELLKAAINAGSLAKAGPNLKNHEVNYQYTLDSSVDYNVLQIMANLIDQFDGDSYPTQVRIAAGGLRRIFRGVEDLPYFYRYHPFSVVTRQPSPLLAKTDKVVFYDGSNMDNTKEPPEDKGYTVERARIASPNGVVDPGEAWMMYVPEVWNPHDSQTIKTGTSSRPSHFRIVATTADPALPTNQLPIWKIKAWFSPYVSTRILPNASQPKSAGLELNEANSGLIFSDAGGGLFREPTLLWRINAPLGANLVADTGNMLGGPVTESLTGTQYLGIPVGKGPLLMEGTVTYPGVPQDVASRYLFQATLAKPDQDVPVGGFPAITFRLQYRKSAGDPWITYDEKYPDLHGISAPEVVVNSADFNNQAWKNPFRSGQLRSQATGYDPRTPRFAIGTESSLGKDSTIRTLEATTAANYYTDSPAGNTAVANSLFTIIETQRPDARRGNQVNYSNVAMTSDPGKNQQMRFFAGVGYSASNGQNASPTEYDGLWSQNNPAIRIQNRVNTGLVQFFYEDPDGIGRRAMGAYADITLVNGAPTAGMPHATAHTYPAGSFGVGSATAQSQSRPLILNRPFRSVAEMSYASRGGLWKQLDFFTPESGDTALLDVFTINEAPEDAIVAGKVNLNTRQTPVLAALLSGAYREETASKAAPLGSYALNPLSAADSSRVASKLVSITSDSTSAWRGPLASVGDLVGKYVPNAGNTSGATDVYSFTEPISGIVYVYSGLSGALDSTVYTDAPVVTPAIQRLRETAVRPLAGVGQVRTWNLMFDVVAQVGRFSANATGLDGFTVEGEKRYWVHIAIDRLTGQVIDRQLELVSE